MDQLTSAQISEWEAYDKIDPIGTWRDVDYPMAFLAHVITNLAISINAKEGTPMTKAMDFMPNWSGEEVEEEVVIQSPEEILAAFKKIANTQNKKIKRENIKSDVVEKIKAAKQGIQPQISDNVKDEHRHIDRHARGNQHRPGQGSSKA